MALRPLAAAPDRLLRPPAAAAAATAILAAPPEHPILLDEIGRLLRHHDHGGVRVAARNPAIKKSMNNSKKDLLPLFTDGFSSFVIKKG